MNIVKSLLVVILFVAGSLAVGLGVTKFEYSNDYREFFSEDNPQLVAWEKMKRTFIKSDSILIALSPKEGDVFSRQGLESIAHVTEEGWQIPYAVRVDSLTNYQHISADGDEVVVQDLVFDVNQIDKDGMSEVRNIALSDPKLVDFIVSSNGKTTGVVVTVQLPDTPHKQIEEIQHYMEKLVPRLEAEHPNMEFYISGSVAYNYSLSSATKDDLRTIVLYMYIAVMAIVFALFRSLSAVFVAFLLISLTNAVAMGAAGWLGILLMPPNLSAPTILMTLVIANFVHVMVAFLQGYRSREDKDEAIRKASRANRKPIIIANVTTSLGFLTMNFSDVPPYHDLGNIVALGTLYILVLTIYLLPHIIRLIPIKPREVQADKVGALYREVYELVVKWPGRICIMFGLLVTSSIYGVTQLELNDRFVEWMDPVYKFRQDTDYINENLTGFYLLEWALDSGDQGGINDPNYLQELEDFHHWLVSQPGVVHVNSLAPTFKELNESMQGGDSRYYRVPQSKELAAQLLLVYEMSLPMGLDMNNMVNMDKSSTRLVVRTSNLSANELLDLEARAVNWLSNNASPSMVSPAASTTILFSHIAQRNIKSLLGGTLIALLLISMLMVFPFRSWKYGVLSIVPNLLPALVAFGVWGILIGDVGLAISVVVGMTMGVVVDDSVHFISKYLYFKRDQGMTCEMAIRTTFCTVGPAISGTSLILIGGFSVLAMSNLNLNSQMGVLTALTVFVAWVADMFLLPSLILLIDREVTVEGREAVLV